MDKGYVLRGLTILVWIALIIYAYFNEEGFYNQ
ncbi:hypothetical protein SAMN04488569_100353 [Marinilactibacillus piezotolerans]|uniref:Uncharacterized protein n=1 Tax=Marinilactibacillus piezotolerans TaxID=258723 RepID=A0A1I3VI29_9LACT|nr:hypothetical protein SAMN04488569_100353 [Marinilactibacillus piezotolerans]